jgi:crossover junction endodeoxyribonuclease RuvC
MKVLGVDPSLRSTGYAVLEGDRKAQRVLEYGVFKTRKGASIPESIDRITRGIEDVVRRHSPDCLAIEEVFTARNSRVALSLGHVRGAIILICDRCGLETVPYAATRIKETVAGYGRAGKEQVQNMVVRTLRLTETPPPDAADALAAALTHIFRCGEGDLSG